MSKRPIPCHCGASRRAAGAAFWARLGIFLSVSGTLEAGSILQMNSVRTPGRAAGTPAGPTPGAAAQSGMAARNSSLARTVQALQSVQAMQQAARAAAKAGSSSLGQNPNRPGTALPQVPNGLGVGGLLVAPGVPKNLAKPGAGEDASLWVGASLPKSQVAGGQTKVTIRQTKQQAILNWKNFNVGRETTLSFDHWPMRDGHPAARKTNPTTYGVEGEYQTEQHTQPSCRSGTWRRGGGCFHCLVRHLDLRLCHHVQLLMRSPVHRTSAFHCAQCLAVCSITGIGGTVSKL